MNRRQLQVGALHPADLGDEPEDRLGGPGAAVEGDGDLRGQHPLEVGCQPAPGDVGHRVGAGAAREGEAGLGVDPRRLQQLFPHRPAQLGYEIGGL